MKTLSEFLRIMVIMKTVMRKYNRRRLLQLVSSSLSIWLIADLVKHLHSILFQQIRQVYVVYCVAVDQHRQAPSQILTLFYKMSWLEMILMCLNAQCRVTFFTWDCAGRWRRPVPAPAVSACSLHAPPLPHWHWPPPGRPEEIHWGRYSQSALSLVQLIHYCALIGPANTLLRSHWSRSS